MSDTERDLPDTDATPDTDVSTEAEALEEGAPESSGAIDTDPEPAPAEPADTDATVDTGAPESAYGEPATRPDRGPEERVGE